VLVALVTAGCGSSSSNPQTVPDAGGDAGITDAGDAGGPGACVWCAAGPARPDRISVSSIWGTSPTDIWLSGRPTPFERTDAVNMFHWDGAGYHEYRVDNLSAQRVFGLDASHVWGVGGGAIAAWVPAESRFKQLSSSTQTTPGLSGDYVDLWGTGPDNLWAVGDNGLSTARLIHWDGGAWGASDAPELNTSVALHAIWGSSADDIWAVGDGVFHKGATATWTKVDVGAPANQILEGVCGTSSDDVWVVGDRSTVRHKQGSTWSAVDIAAPALTQLHSCRADGAEVWIVGDLVGGAEGGGAAVFHWNGARWAKEQTFRLDGTRFDNFPVATAGRVGAELWVTDQHGVLYKSR